MAKVFASGTFTLSADRFDIPCSAQHTTEFGFLLSGTWGVASAVRPRPGNVGSVQSMVRVDPADGTRSIWSFGANGLYFLKGNFENLFIIVIGPDGDTDLDWALFLKPRP